MRGKTWLFIAVKVVEMCTAPANQSATGIPATPPPPMPSVARYSNAQPPMASTATATPAVAPVASASIAGAAGAAPSPAAAPAASVAPIPETTTEQAAPAPKTQAGANGLTVPEGESASTVTGFQTTHYGYPDDETPDENTKAGKGKWGPLVDGDSLALTDSMAQKIGAKPHDKIELKDAKGNTRVGTYIDRAPESDDRVDIYNPKGSKKGGTPFSAISAKKIESRVASTAETLYPKG